MIFVSVGTHEQQFNRLVSEVDDLVGKGIINEQVFIQTGFSTYRPEHCSWQSSLAFEEVREHILKADIIITHGGPSSFLIPVQLGKIPIVVPRYKCFSEHVNDHQVEFVRAVRERHNNIIPIYDIKLLGKTINNYESLTSKMKTELPSNNAQFNLRLSKMVNDLVEQDK